MINKKFFALLLIATLSQTMSFANAANNGKGKTEMKSAAASPSANSSAGAITTSTWLSPTLARENSTPAPTLVRITPGSAIPVKFRLFNSGVEIKSTQGVALSTVAAPCVGVSPSPTPSNLGNTTPGNSDKSKSSAYSLKYNPSGFSANWKSAKNASGCFQFKVTYSTGTLYSPTFLFGK